MELELLKMTCSMPQIDMQTAKVIIQRYIFYTKGVNVNIVGDITNIPEFEQCITIACNYFLTK